MRFISAFFTALLCTSALAHASGVWTVTTADFKHRQVVLKSIGQGGITVVLSGSGEEVQVPYDQLLRLQRAPAAALPADRWVAYLRNGDRIVGMPQGLKGEVLEWRSALLGEIQLPLQAVRAIAQGQRPSDEFDLLHRQDTVLLRNGDVVRGIIVDIQPARFTLSVGTSQVPVPMESIVCAYLADVAQPNEKPVRAMRLDLADGSRVSAASIRTGGEDLEIELPGGVKRRVQLSDVGVIEQLNGPVSWLSGRRPASSEHRPYFEGSFPARMDRNLAGGPIVLDKRLYERGIAVHSYSRLSWDLDGTYKAFRTQYVIDPAQPRTEKADVTVRIYADERVVHEDKGFRAATRLSKPVLVDLTGATRLTLEVDYGANYDVQDRLIWIEPALLRDMPKAPEPTRQPATRAATLPADPAAATQSAAH